MCSLVDKTDGLMKSLCCRGFEWSQGADETVGGEKYKVHAAANRNGRSQLSTTLLL